MIRPLFAPKLRPALACLSLLATPGQALSACDPGETDLRFSLAVPLDDTTEGATALAFADAVDTALQGRYCVTLHPDGTLFADDSSALVALRTGQIAFAVPSLDGLTGVAPGLALLDLPFLFDGPLHLIHYLESDAAAPLLAQVSTDGLTGYGIIATGSRQFVGPRVLDLPESAAGLAIIPAEPGQHFAAMVAALGASAATAADATLATALANATDTAAEATWATIDYGYLYAPPAVVTETNHGVTGFAVVGSQSVIGALPAKDRAVLEDLTRAVVHRQTVLAFERARISRQVVLDDGGRLVTLSAEGRTAFRTALAPLIEAARTSLGADLVDAAIASNAEVAPPP